MSDTKVRHRRLYYTGFLLATVGYGMHLLLSITILAILSRRRYRKSLGHRLALPFSVIMVFCSTVTWSMDAWKVERSLVEQEHNSASGSQTSCRDASEIITAILHTLPILLSDALLFYRAWIIVNRRISWLVAPAILYLASCGLALVVVSQCRSRTAVGFVRTIHLDVYPVIFFAFTVALNIYLTGAIILKLQKARRAVVGLGPFMTAQVQPYTSVIGIFVESALPYSALGVFYIATIISASSVQYISGRLFFASSCLCPAFIVIRIVLGVSYTPSEKSIALQETHHTWVYRVEQEVHVDAAMPPPLVSKRRARAAGRRVPLSLLPTTAELQGDILSLDPGSGSVESVCDAEMQRGEPKLEERKFGRSQDGTDTT